VTGGKVWRVWPEEGRKELVADTGGGANAAALASDGGFLVTQNGGLDFNGLGIAGGPWTDPRFMDPGLQRVHPDGSVTYLVGGLSAPNDLVVAPDGTVYFTNPAKWPAPPGATESNVMAYRPDGTCDVIADGFEFCNGIALDPDGNLCVTEKNGLLRIAADGSREWIVENLSENYATDGLCFDQTGVCYLAGASDHGIRIVDDGEVVDFWATPGEGATTNCCFGGPEGRWLFATDAVPGQVVVWDDAPSPGREVYVWPVRDQGSGSNA
jgi:gluconolactonase